MIFIVRPLAGRNLILLQMGKAYQVARPEAYQIVDMSEDGRASISQLN
ncbi:MAG: hypothetical protein M3Q05_03420 [Bacteroidota bacterium]|nr:hypothetical protein [Bacteroidota bacterium]